MNFGWTHENEILNGRIAMAAVMFAIVSELTTGTLTFGLF
jgi:hypothetical protein